MHKIFAISHFFAAIENHLAVSMSINYYHIQLLLGAEGKNNSRIHLLLGALPAARAALAVTKRQLAQRSSMTVDLADSAFVTKAERAADALALLEVDTNALVDGHGDLAKSLKLVDTRLRSLCDAVRCTQSRPKCSSHKGTRRVD